MVLTLYPLLEVVPTDNAPNLFLSTLEAFPFASPGFNVTLAAFVALDTPLTETVYVGACPFLDSTPLSSHSPSCSARADVFGVPALPNAIRQVDVTRVVSSSGNSVVWISRAAQAAQQARLLVALTCVVIALLVAASVAFSRDAHRLLIDPIDKSAYRTAVSTHPLSSLALSPGCSFWALFFRIYSPASPFRSGCAHQPAGREPAGGAGDAPHGGVEHGGAGDGPRHLRAPQGGQPAAHQPRRGGHGHHHRQPGGVRVRTSFCSENIVPCMF